MNKRAKGWLKRYLPAELLSLAVTIAATLITSALTQNRITTALAGTWLGTIAYFGYILIADIIIVRRELRASGRQYTTVVFLKNFRALFLEFGIAELFDSFLIRPALMYYLPLATGNLLLGSILAKFAADVTFYVPAITSYEICRSRFRNF